MPKTEHVEKHHHVTDTEEVPMDMPTRDEATQQKIDETETLLDEIDFILETETAEPVLTIADLIRGGAKLRPQVFGSLYDYDMEGECVGTCAIGAAEDEAKRLGLL